MNKVSKARKKKTTGRKYAVMNPDTGETFSPKEILRTIIGTDFVFLGGKGPNGANRLFTVFSFPVGKERDLQSKHDKLVRLRMNLELRAPEVTSTEELLDALFSQKWRLFTKKEIHRLGDSGAYPGVYVLAYSNTNLVGRAVLEYDIFYAGMTCEGGLKARLEQFRKGIVDGVTHSGAARFHRFWLKRKPYPGTARARLFFAYVRVKCETSKEWRTPRDILNLSKVVELELATIARVKRALNHEPLLNKK